MNRINIGACPPIVAMDIRQSLHYLGEITGEITTDDLLANLPAGRQVFSRSFVLGSNTQLFDRLRFIDWAYNHLLLFRLNSNLKPASCPYQAV